MIFDKIYLQLYNNIFQQIIDFEEYYLDLAEANANPDAPTNWKQLYASAKKEYGLENMAATEWNKLIDRMDKDDSLFKTYIK